MIDWTHFKFKCEFGIQVANVNLNENLELLKDVAEGS